MARGSRGILWDHRDVSRKAVFSRFILVQYSFDEIVIGGWGLILKTFPKGKKIGLMICSATLLKKRKKITWVFTG